MRLTVLTLISRYHGKAQNPKQFSPSEPCEGHFEGHLTISPRQIGEVPNQYFTCFESKPDLLLLTRCVLGANFTV